MLSYLGQLFILFILLSFEDGARISLILSGLACIIASVLPPIVLTETKGKVRVKFRVNGSTAFVWISCIR